MFVWFFLDFSRDLSTGRKPNNAGVLRMLPQSQSRIIVRGDANGGSNNASAPLDLSGGKENGAERQSESPKSDRSASASTSSGGGHGHGHAEASITNRRRRKGPAFKLDLAVRQRLQDTAAVEEEEEATESDELRPPDSTDAKFQVVQPESPPDAAKSAGKSSLSAPAVNGLTSNGKRERRGDLVCGYCSMTFEDRIMHHMHMDFHKSQEDPFTCKCGHAARDKVSFFVHIARAPHA